jgi:hypothetical protein
MDGRIQENLRSAASVEIAEFETEMEIMSPTNKIALATSTGSY